MAACKHGILSRVLGSSHHQGSPRYGNGNTSSETRNTGRGHMTEFVTPRNVWYNWTLNQFFQDEGWSCIASEIVYLIYAMKGAPNINTASLYDIVQENPDKYHALSILSRQQFMWRTTVVLNVIGGWQKQSMNSCVWWRVKDDGT